ncbi:MAG: SHOCT domain-containing protein [Caldisericum sp.]
MSWIIIIIVFGILGLFSAAELASYFGWHSIYVTSILVTAIVYIVVFLILLIPTILVIIRTNKMRIAANKGDIKTLKELNSIGWAIVALIFSGIIPGIMLLVAAGPINSLEEGGLSDEIIDKMMKLKTMLDSGLITKEEFDQQKAKLTASSAASTGGLEEQLNKLKTLLDSGVISQSEYEEQRKAILKKL